MADAARSPAVDHPSRRDFITGSTAAIVGGALTSSLAIPRSVHAAGSDVIKVGLVGCGGRGTGAAGNALDADPNVQLTAVGDAFGDRLEGSLKNLRSKLKGDAEKRIAVTPATSFVGFDAYQKVIDSGVDVVLLCSPPHFRPEHLRAAVAAGKHVFCEKPMAVDAPGVRSCLASVAESKKKGLSVVSGFCNRYDLPQRETMKRVHDGMIGDVVAIQETYNTGLLWSRPRKPEWSDTEWQMRNWLYFTWLSGDHNVEQHIHSLDKIGWVLGEKTPVSAMGLGGRQVRTGPEFGNIYDHHAVVFEYDNGVKVFAYTRQQEKCDRDVSDTIFGTKGRAMLLGGNCIYDRNNEIVWKYDSKAPYTNMYVQEHIELFDSIRGGKAKNDGDFMIKSTMLAILGRMATYTGQTITWDAAINSKENLTPEAFLSAASADNGAEALPHVGPYAYKWCDLPVPPVPMPGYTKFV